MKHDTGPAQLMIVQDEEDSKPEAPPTPKADRAGKEAKLRSKDEGFNAKEQQR